MAGTTIDQISLELNASASKAQSAVTSLIRVTKELQQAFSSLSTASVRVNTALSSIKKGNSAYTQLATNAEKVKQAMAKTEIANNRVAQSAQKVAIETTRAAAAQERLKQASANAEAAATRLAITQEKLKQTVVKNQNAVNKTKNAYGDLSGVLGGIKTAGLIASFYTIGDVLGSFITKSNAYIENLNLFSVQMGEFTNEAEAFVEQLESVLGVDPSEAMRYMGFFMQLTQSMGVASDKAYIMSKNLTQLGYDISSFVNIPIDDAMQKLQAGLAGEIEPLRRIGYSLTENQMQTALDQYSAAAQMATSTTRDMTNSMYENSSAAILNANFIGAKVRSLNDAQKEELRYVMIMQQSVLAQGDMARTLQSPANQLRIFRQELNMAARAIGNVFIPILNAIIPVAIAVAQVIRAVMESIAALFGFELPEVDYSGLGQVGSAASNAASGVGDLGDSLGGTADQADKAKKAINDLLGPMDELHILNTDMGSGAGAGGGGGGGGGVGGIGDLGGGLFDQLPQYDAFKDAITSKIDEIRKKIEELLPFILAVGTAFLAWKIGKKIFDNLDAIKAALRTFGLANLASPWKTLLGVLGVVVGELAFLTGFYDSLLYGADLKSFITMLGGAALASGILAGVLGKLKASFMLLTANGILMAVAGLKDLLTGNYSIWSAVEAVTGLAIAVNALRKISPAMAAIGAPLLALIGGLTEVAVAGKRLNEGDASLPVLATGIAGVGISAVGAGKLVKGLAEKLSTTKLATGALAGIIPKLGAAAIPVAIVVAALGAAFLGFKYAMSDSLDEIDIYEGELKTAEGTIVEVTEKTQEAVSSFLEAWDTLNQQTIAINWSGLAPTEEQLAQISQSVSAVEETLLDSVGSMQEKSLEALGYLKESLGKEYGGILSSVQEFYNNEKSTIQSEGEEINQIYADLAAGRITDTEAAEARIEEIKQKWRTTGIENLSESVLESKIILQNLKDNTGQLTAEAAAEAIANAKTQKEETIKEAQEQYDQILLEAEKMYAVGSISKEQYEMIRQAAKTSYDQQVADADTAFENIKNTAVEEMGVMAVNFDENTGEMRSKWAVFKDELIEGLKGIPAEAKKGFGEMKAALDEKIQPMKEKFGEFKNDVFNGLKAIPSEARKGFNEMKDALFSKVSEMVTKIKEFASGIYTNIKNNINLEKIKEIGKNILNGIINGMWFNLYNKVKEWVNGFKDKVLQAFEIFSPSKLMKREVGRYVTDGIIVGAIDRVKAGTELLAESFTSSLNENLSESLTSSKELLRSKVIDMMSDSSAAMSESSAEWGNTLQDVIDMASNVFETAPYTPELDYSLLIAQAEEAGELAYAAILEQMRNAKIQGEGLEYDMTFKYTTDMSDALGGSGEALSDISETLISDYESTSAYQTSSLESMSNMSTTVTDLFTNATEKVETLASQAFDVFNDYRSDLLSTLKSEFNRAISAINNIRIEIYNNYYMGGDGFAAGGFPSMGELFYANENGAELIGSIGSRTAVVNNDQIVSAVSQGVAAAVYEVMRLQNERPLDVRVSLDGKEIYTNQQKVKREMGVDFEMGAFTR